MTKNLCCYVHIFFHETHIFGIFWNISYYILQLQADSKPAPHSLDCNCWYLDINHNLSMDFLCLHPFMMVLKASFAFLICLFHQHFSWISYASTHSWWSWRHLLLSWLVFSITIFKAHQVFMEKLTKPILYLVFV